MLFLLATLIAVTAIPWKVHVQPEGVRSTTGRRIILEHTQRPDITDADAFCRYYYHPWWRDYPILREYLRTHDINARERGTAEYDALVAIQDIVGDNIFDAEYTKYSTDLLDVPVEAIDGEDFIPRGTGNKHGHMKRPYGCFHGCQDIRTMFEWVISSVVESRVNIRAKWLFMFTCGEGMVSETYDKESKREHDRVKDKLAAALLKHGKFATYGDEASFKGDERPIVKGCRCVPETPERAAHEKLRAAARKSRTYFSVQEGEPRRSVVQWHKHRPRGEWTAEDQTDQSRRDRRVKKRFRIRHLEQDRQMEDDVGPPRDPKTQCQDLADELEEESVSPVYRVSTDFDEDQVTASLQWTISALAGFDIPSDWFRDAGSSSRNP